MTSLKEQNKDRRVKLSDTQRESIRIEYANGDTSYNKLANKYNVSKRLIIFVVNPDKAKIAREQFKQRRLDGRYKPSKKKWRDIMREHRAWVKSLG